MHEAKWNREEDDADNKRTRASILRAVISNASDVFADNCVAGLKADKKRIAASVEQSLMLGTALAPVIGYNKAAEIAHHAYETGQTIREYCLTHDILDAKTLDEVLDVTGMTHPH